MHTAKQGDGHGLRAIRQLEKRRHGQQTDPNGDNGEAVRVSGVEEQADQGFGHAEEGRHGHHDHGQRQHEADLSATEQPVDVASAEGASRAHRRRLTEPDMDHEGGRGELQRNPVGGQRQGADPAHHDR